MASASTPTPLLPVTNLVAGGASTPTSSSMLFNTSLATPASRLFMSWLSEMARHLLADRKSWTELLDRSAFSRSDSLSDATERLRHNLGYFRVNYAVVVAFSLAASLLDHPFSLLILLSILDTWCFLYVFRASDQPIVLFRCTFNDREMLVGLVIASVLAFFLTSMASLIISNGNPTNKLLSFLASPGSRV
jgi:PRA1 family protein 1